MAIIGIVGGLGPYSHIEFERLLLRASDERLGRAALDQDYPEWILSSLPRTPDRSAALIDGGASPLPALVQSVQRLARAGADFAVVVCNTAHAFIDDLRLVAPIPILDMVELTLEHASRQLRGSGPPGRLGLLATTGTLHARLYHDRVAQDPGLELISLLDLPGGDKLQERLVMGSIYGPLDGGRRIGGGLKAGYCTPEIETALRSALRYLADAGAELVLCGCTELPLALDRISTDEIALLDPMRVLATRAVAMAFDDIALPE